LDCVERLIRFQKEFIKADGVDEHKETSTLALYLIQKGKTLEKIQIPKIEILKVFDQALMFEK